MGRDWSGQNQPRYKSRAYDIKDEALVCTNARVDPVMLPLQ